MSEVVGPEDSALEGDVKVEPYKPFPTFSEWAQISFDASTFRAFASQLRDAKEKATPVQLEEAVRIATKWAAVNTGAIEGLYEVDRGFTYSVAMNAAAWSGVPHSGVTPGGPPRR